jgi:homoprotocatechuate degradation regulator HpaR
MIRHPDPLAGGGQLELETKGMPIQTRRSLPIALLRAREAVMSKFRPMLARHDINEQQWRVIRMLGEHGELDASQLAGKALVLAPSLTRMIRTLEKARLITKRKDKDDKRRTLVSISAKGRSLINEVAPESAEIYSELQKKFGKADMERLLDLLETVIQQCEPTESTAL